MPSDKKSGNMDPRLALALSEIDAIVQATPNLTLDKDYLPGFPGGTNTALFGHLNGKPIVFKYFHNKDRKDHEEKVLKLFQKTGYVPQLYPIKNDSLLIIERLPGLPFFMVEENVSLEEWEGLFNQLGQVLAEIVKIAPGSDLATSGRQDLPREPGFDYKFYRTANLETFFDTVIEISAGVLETSDLPHQALLEDSLNDLRTNRDAILAYRNFIFLDDFHYSNIIAEGPTLQGFIDLEMSRYSNEVLVLGSVMASVIPSQLERWSWIKTGYETVRGNRLDPEIIYLSEIVAPFNRWIRFMWYWGCDEVPDWAKEKNLRMSVIQDIKDVVNVIESLRTIS